MVRIGRVGIVGAGALGSYFGIRLAASGLPVAFVLRSDYQAVARDGMELTLAGGEVLRLKRPEIFRDTAAMGEVDVLLVGLKTTAQVDLRLLLGPAVGPKTLLVTLQNGLGNIEALTEAFPQNPVTAVLCKIGVNRLGPGQVRSFVPRDGSVLLGVGRHAGAQWIDPLADVLTAAGIQVNRFPCLEEAIWRKLMWNVPYNGLTVAVGGVATDAICADPALREAARTLMEEVRAAAGALGYAIEPEYTEAMLTATDRMGAYLPSSVLDWRAGRPLEVEAIFRKPLLAGLQAGVSMPYLTLLTAILHGLNRNRPAG